MAGAAENDANAGPSHHNRIRAPCIRCSTSRSRRRARAGSIINRAALDGSALEVRAKRANDFVTQVDKAAESAVIDIIRQAYPDHGILAEESGDSRQRAEAEYLWIIDPLDGTTNFIHGFPQYCVSIALEHRGAIQHGVVYDPAKNELFTASKGRGAFLDDRRIRVSKCAKLEGRAGRHRLSVQGTVAPRPLHEAAEN